MIVKVDRVCTADEATQLERHGATHLCCDVDRIAVFDDDRILSPDAALALSAATVHSTFGLRVGPWMDEPNHWLPFIERCGPGFVDVAAPANIDAEFRDGLRKLGIPFGISRLDADHDDDPSWVLSRYEEILSEPAYFQVEALTSMRDSWRFWKDESPRFPDELQIGDVEELARRHPVLIALDFDPSTVLEVLDRIPSARGIALALVDDPERERAVHCHGLEQIRAILGSLSEAGRLGT